VDAGCQDQVQFDATANASFGICRAARDRERFTSSAETSAFSVYFPPSRSFIFRQTRS